MSEVTVITEALQAEAGKWHSLASDMTSIQEAAADLTLAMSAFFIAPTEMASTLLHSNAYDGYQEYVSTLLSQAVTEFDQLGDALTRIAKEYDKADEIVALDLDQIYTAP